MARHPPLRHRVQQLSQVPVALWRRLVNAVAFVVTWFTLWLPGAATATVLACLFTLWVWAGSDNSLQQTLQLARPWVPALDALTLDDTEASLREGGTVARLTWTDGQGLTVSATAVELTWDLMPLIKAEPLTIHLKADTATVSDTSPPSTTPPTLPETLALPLDLRVNVAIGRLTLTGTQPVHIDHIQGTYSYEGDDEEARHLLQDFQLEVAQGRYKVEAALQAAAPMTLNADVQGSVKGQIPALGNELAQSWQGRLTAHIRGELANTPVGGSAPDKEASVTIQAKLLDESLGARSVRPALDATATLRPWRKQPLHALQAQIKHLNLATFWPQLPTTMLSGQTTAQPISQVGDSAAVQNWQVHVSLANAAAGAWDLGKLPFTTLQLQGNASQQTVDVTRLLAKVGEGNVQGQGHWQLGQPSAQAKLTFTAVPLHSLHTGLAPALMSGDVAIHPTARSETDVAIHLNSVLLPEPTRGTPGESKPQQRKRALAIKTIKALGAWNGQRLSLSELLVRAAGAEAQGNVDVATRPLTLGGNLRLRAPGMAGELKGHMSAEQGQGQVTLAATDLAKLKPWLQALPGLEQAVPAPLMLTGDAQFTAQWRGGWSQSDGPDLKVQLSSERLSAQPTSAQPVLKASAIQLKVEGNLQSTRAQVVGDFSHRDLRVHLAGQAHADGLSPSGGQLVLEQLQARLHGAQSTQALTVQTASPVTVVLRDTQWNVGPGELTVQASPRNPTSLAEARERAPASVTATTAKQLTRFNWQKLAFSQGVLRTEGRISQLGLAWLDSAASLLGNSDEHWLADAGLSTDLQLQGRWQLSWPTVSATPGPSALPQLLLEIERQQGDLRMRNPDAADTTSPWIPAELKQAKLTLRTQGSELLANLAWDSRLGGQLQGQVRTALQGSNTGWTLTPDAPLSATLQTKLPELSLWSTLMAPPGWRAKGRLQLEASASGTLGKPNWQGQLEATDLALRSLVEGLEFGNGRLVARLSGEQIDITQLSLEGAGGAKQGGTLSGTGSATWTTGANALPEHPRIRLQARADKLRVSARADRRLTLSGDVSAALEDQLLRLRGELTVDQALFILPDETAPTLGDDVVVRQARAASLEKGSRVKSDIQVTIALGEKLEVRGQGLQTRLGGKVTLVSTPNAPTLRVVGEVKTLDGSYRAYGQQLRMTEGVIRFSGPYDDPSLNILAVRPASVFRDSDTQVVGVKITGTARAPRVSLYANPDLPDSEKLAWLVLGRKASGSGAEAAILQQAALALLSGNGGAMDASLATRLGLDDISFRGASTQADGTTQAAGVALGKRLSARLYMVFETGLNSAMGTVSLFYDVSRRLTLRARAGEENAIDLIFTLPHE